jgi:hypothetical protein
VNNVQDKNRQITGFLSSEYFLSYMTYQMAYLKNVTQNARRTIPTATEQLMECLRETQAAHHKDSVPPGLESALTSLEYSLSSISFAAHKRHSAEIYDYMCKHSIRKPRAFLMVAYIVSPRSHENELVSHMRNNYPKRLDSEIWQNVIMKTVTNSVHIRSPAVSHEIGHVLNDVATGVYQFVLRGGDRDPDDKDILGQLQSFLKNPWFDPLSSLLDTAAMIFELYGVNQDAWGMAIDLLVSKIRKHISSVNTQSERDELSDALTVRHSMTYGDHGYRFMSPLMEFVDELFPEADDRHAFILRDVEVDNVRSMLEGITGTVIH